MPNDTLVISLSEKDRYDYVYVDEDNIVHLLCPLIGGDTIGLDNTCQTTKEMRRFFGVAGGSAGESALQVFLGYHQDLNSDIRVLQSINTVNNNVYREILEHKQKRLKQIEEYIRQLQRFSRPERERLFRLDDNRLGIYSDKVTQILTENSNCVSIQLSPKDPDTFYNLQTEYVFISPKSLGSSLHLFFYKTFRCQPNCQEK